MALKDISGIIADTTVRGYVSPEAAASIAARDREMGAQVRALQSHLDALRIISGAAPGSQSDAEVAGFVWDAGSHTRTALDGLYVSTITGDQIRATAEQAIAEATDAREQASATGASLTSLTDRVSMEEQARTALASRVGAAESDIGALEQRLDSLPAPTPDTGTGTGGGQVIYLSAYCKGDGSDEAAAMRSAVNLALTEGRLLVCDVPKVIGLGSMVTLGDERANSDQKSILSLSGNLRVKALESMEVLLRISGTITGDGNIEADGGTLAHYAVYFKNWGRLTLNRIHAYRALASGVGAEPTGNNNAWSIEKLRVHDCGTKVETTATVSARRDVGSWAATGDDAPFSTWTLDKPLPAQMTSREWAVPVAVMGDGRVMAVKRVVNSTTVEIFNENKPIGTTDTLKLATAAVAFPYYGDVGIWTIGNADVRQNADAWAMNYGGYGGFVGAWAQQNNFGGTVIPKWAIGLSFGMFYTEKSGATFQGTPWLAVRSTAMTTLFVGPGTNLEPDNWQGLDLSWMSLPGRNKQPLHWQMFKMGRSPLALPPSAPLDAPEHNPGTRNLTPGTLQMYTRTSGAYGLRIANALNPGGVGMVTLTAPTTGGGTAVNLSLLTSNGDTIQGAATHSLTIWGTVTLTYGRVGTDWKITLTGVNAPA